MWYDHYSTEKRNQRRFRFSLLGKTDPFALFAVERGEGATLARTVIIPGARIQLQLPFFVEYEKINSTPSILIWWKTKKKAITVVELIITLVGNSVFVCGKYFYYTSRKIVTLWISEQLWQILLHFRGLLHHKTFITPLWVRQPAWINPISLHTNWNKVSSDWLRPSSWEQEFVFVRVLQCSWLS